MNRFVGMLLTAFYVIGGAFTGYYAYMLRLVAETDGLTFSTVLDWTMATPAAIAGPVLVIIAILVHKFEITHARAEIRAVSLEQHRAEERLAAAESQVASNTEVLDWVKGAIEEGVAKDAVRKANEEFPPAIENKD